MFNIINIINKKSENISLTKDEIDFFINGVMDESIKDYQISSLLMAIKINGLNDEETINYASALINSGETLPLQEDLVDKHSSGGIGDKTTIALLPILGSMGLKVFKISGRGLGFTGGTVDKLESINGFNTNLSIDQLNKMVDEIGISLTSQTPNLTPADGKIYALRDITGTVDSIPLIAASIISKKIASGAKNIVIDLKVGSGAFVSDIEHAKELARLMKIVATAHNRNLFILFSSMNQPLGKTIGNKIEILEAVDFLKGKSTDDFSKLIKKIATVLYAKVKNVSIEKSTKIYDDTISSGKALKLQEEWFIKSGATNLENSLVSKATNKQLVKSPTDGFVHFNDVKKIGFELINIKAGRKSKTDLIDYESGMILNKKDGDYVKEGELLFEVISSNPIPKEVINNLLNIYNINNDDSKNEIILGELQW